ncbi:hypothetical protein D1794_29165 (plasmid) [Streptomyces clavuligerus]|nr:hypothetical protein D1794_29165 [Streptomyces clavuligerus]
MLWSTTVGGILLTAGLIIVSVVTDLGIGNQIAGIASPVTGVIAIWAAIRLAQTSRGGGGPRVQAGQGATVIVGDTTDSAIGDHSHVTTTITAPPPGPPPTGPAGQGGAGTSAAGPGADVSAAAGSTAIIGNVARSALGRGSRIIAHRSIPEPAAPEPAAAEPGDNDSGGGAPGEPSGGAGQAGDGER